MTKKLPKITEVDNGVTIEIKVKLGSSVDSIGDIHDHKLKVNVVAQPEKSKANAAVINLISQSLKIPKSRIEIIKGAHNPQKTLLLVGVSLNEFIKIFEEILSSQ